MVWRTERCAVIHQWLVGTVVGVGIDTTQPVATIEFFFDGRRLTLPKIPLLTAFGNAVVGAVSVQGGENQGVELNFGERPLRHQPVGYSSIYECSRRNFSDLLKFGTSTRWLGDFCSPRTNTPHAIGMTGPVL